MHLIILDNIKVNYKYILSFRARRFLLKIKLNEKTDKYFVQIVIPYFLLKNYNFSSFINIRISNILKHLNAFNNVSQGNKVNINILDNKYSKIRKDGLLFLISKKNWILKSLAELNLNKDLNNNINKNLNIDSREHFLKFKSKALTLCENKVKYWSEKMGNLDYNNIKVKKLKTRWGSCSSKKNLNFNYKIIFLSEEDKNYLIVHELAHLIHMNHSKNFWNLVCEILSDKKYYKYKIR